MFSYLFGAVLVSWLVSIYYIWGEKEITHEKFCKILTVSVLTGLLWPVIMFFLVVSTPAFLISKVIYGRKS